VNILSLICGVLLDACEMLSFSSLLFPSKYVVQFHLAVRMLREELQLLQEPGSYVGEVVKVMGKSKVLVKVHSLYSFT
jgi:hypothetical protein